MLPGRTTADAVRAIIQTIKSVDLDPYIDAANELVSERCTGIFPGTLDTLNKQDLPSYVPAPGGFQYSAYRLELIERWLSAHFYAVMDPRSVMEGAGSVKQELQGKVDLGLRSSLYGQQAMRLDTQGALAILDNSMNKYTKVPAAAVQTPIGITFLGRRRRPNFWGGGWTGG